LLSVTHSLKHHLSSLKAWEYADCKRITFNVLSDTTHTDMIHQKPTIFRYVKQ